MLKGRHTTDQQPLGSRGAWALLNSNTVIRQAERRDYGARG